MNYFAVQNQNPNVVINTEGPIINTNTYNGNQNNQVVISNIIINTSTALETIAGSIPVYKGNNAVDTEVSTQINQTISGITITNLIVNNDIQTATIASLNTTISDLTTKLNNAATVIFNLTGITI